MATHGVKAQLNKGKSGCGSILTGIGLSFEFPERVSFSDRMKE